ncbi:mucin-19-like [Hylaeus volcanicus]|uniref:mucin-19-like n=1 Tax=Hylaeus volcanicus TaxID=313075 RepID=UPI0023B8820B|nr:mucin-19-like [Hylaeus volcanicus]
MPAGSPDPSRASQAGKAHTGKRCSRVVGECRGEETGVVDVLGPSRSGTSGGARECFVVLEGLPRPEEVAEEGASTKPSSRPSSTRGLRAAGSSASRAGSRAGQPFAGLAPVCPRAGSRLGDAEDDGVSVTSMSSASCGGVKRRVGMHRPASPPATRASAKRARGKDASPPVDIDDPPAALVPSPARPLEGGYAGAVRRRTTPAAAVGAVDSSTPAVGGETFPVSIKPAGRKKKGRGRKRGAQAALPSTLPQQSLAPPPTNPATAPANPDGAAWSQVVGRRARRAAGTASAAPVTPAPPQKGTSKRAGRLKKAPPRVVAPPRSAAVTITVPEGSKATYEETIRRARQGVDLGALGIEALSRKRAVTGGLIVQVPGADGALKAAALAAKVTAALGSLDVKVARPVKKT